MDRYRGSCWTLEEAGLDIGSCCSSCHEDRDLGYDMCQIDLPNGDWLHVCCWVAGELEETDEAQILAALDANDKSDRSIRRVQQD